MRRLAIASAAFSAAVFAANYILPYSFLVYVAVLMGFCFLALRSLRRKWLLGVNIALAAVAIGLIVFLLHSSKTHKPASELAGQDLSFEAVLLDYPRVYEDYCSANIRISQDGLPRLKALLYDNDCALADAQPGQHIRLSAKLKAADLRYGEEYDYYYSKGIYLIASSTGEISFTGEKDLIASIPSRIRNEVGKLVDELFPADTAGFMRSVMLGDKSSLYDDTALYLALSRAGFMHVAAVSGMHLAFLSGFILLFTGRTRFGSFITIPVLWIFVIITGASPSAVRAAFMQGLLLLAPVLKRENDTPTSLFTVLALVLMANPYAAASVSLQLSFSAMAGLLCFYIPVHNALLGLLPKRCVRYFRNPVGIVSASLSVMVFTLPLTAIHFGSVSILSPISNMLALWAVSLCFSGGFVCCAAGYVFPIVGKALAWLLSWFARYIFLVAKAVSAIDFSTVYLDSPFMKCWFVLSIICVLLTAVFYRSAPLRIGLSLAFSAVLLMQAGILSRWYYSSGMGTMAVLDVGQGQCITAMTKDAAVVVDCGATGTQKNAGEKAGAYLMSRGVNRIDAMLLTHLHSDHANGAIMLMEMLDVDTLFLPAEPVDEEGLLAPVLACAQRRGTQVQYVRDDMSLDFNGIGFELYKSSDRGDANERCVMCCLSLEDYDMLITADSSIAVENDLVEHRDLSHVDAFVVGHHGSRYSTGKALLTALDADMAIISSGYNNYGHPTWETLERLAAYGFDVFRTDLNGTIELRPQMK